MLIGLESPVSPMTVAGSEVTSEPGGTFVLLAKENSFGVVGSLTYSGNQSTLPQPAIVKSSNIKMRDLIDSNVLRKKLGIRVSILKSGRWIYLLF